MPRAASDKMGLIYLIQLFPASRFKVGFTENRDTLERRLKEARTWVPEVELIKCWRAYEKWERQARFVMASRKPIGKALGEFPYSDLSSKAGGEVIDGDGKARLLERGESLFMKHLTIEGDDD